MENRLSSNIGSKIFNNNLVACSFTVLFVYLLTAIFAYLIAPDNSSDANEQISELALHPPGFSIKVLKIKKADTEKKENLSLILFRGSRKQESFIPIYQYAIVQDSIKIKHYKGINPFTKESLKSNEEYYSKAYFSKEPNISSKPPQIFTKSYPLGTDGYGRCILSRLIIGSRVSMTVGLLAVLISMSIGILVGLLAGYLGGKVDDLLMLMINTIWSIPTLLLVFAIVLVMGRGIEIIYLAVGLTLWVDVARIVRGQVLSAKENVFIDAARSLGYGNIRILAKHLLPNILGPIWVISMGNFATAIILEAGLSYLGFGIQPPMPSWGNMLNENYGYALSGNYLVAIFPALAIVILVLTVNIIGNAFRDAYDVKIE